MSERFTMDEMESIGIDESTTQQGFVAAVIGLSEAAIPPAPPGLLGGTITLELFYTVP